jgi:hypothetical protein
MPAPLNAVDLRRVRAARLGRLGIRGGPHGLVRPTRPLCGSSGSVASAESERCAAGELAPLRRIHALRLSVRPGPLALRRLDGSPSTGCQGRVFCLDFDPIHRRFESERQLRSARSRPTPAVRAPGRGARATAPAVDRPRLPEAVTSFTGIEIATPFCSTFAGKGERMHMSHITIVICHRSKTAVLTVSAPPRGRHAVTQGTCPLCFGARGRTGRGTRARQREPPAPKPGDLNRPSASWSVAGSDESSG